MNNYWINGRTIIAFVAICIVSGTIFYSNYLSKKIAKEERFKVESWIEAQRTILKSSDSSSLNLAIKISSENHDIPIIETNENDSITGNYLNLDSILIKNDKDYLQKKLFQLKNQNKPIVTVISQTPYVANKYYYGESVLSKQLKYYPFIQLLIIALFVFYIVASLQIHNKSTQNQLWAGLAKETAHQLGTPVTSLQGWIEVLKEDTTDNKKIISELEKDVQRLLLISDRFGKIGSTPQLEQKNLLSQVEYMVDYMKKRAGVNVEFEIKSNKKSIEIFISPQLFDWVLENILKNALDAMEGIGKIIVEIKEDNNAVIIDITDTGKGISKQNFEKIFKPGFSTKRRGWGLGLTLSKRIVEQYHHGKLLVHFSELNKGTTFRILLNKV